MTKLFEPFNLAGLALRNRIVMAPMTRSRAVGGQQVGVRISPFGRLSDMTRFPDEAETWLALAHAFSQRPLAFVHLSDQLTLGAERMPQGFPKEFRQNFTGTLMETGGFNKETGEAALQTGDLDLIAIHV
jgi:N-ethylmaleimide reductase